MPRQHRAAIATVLASASVAWGCASAPARAPVPPPAPAPAATGAPATKVSAAPAPVETASAPARQGPGWLGVELGSPEPSEAGVLVREVLHGSPAEAAGLAVGDRILRVDSEVVARPQDVVRIVSSHRGGDRLGVALSRDGVDRLIPVLLEARPDADELLRKELGPGPAPEWRPLATVRGSVPATLRELRGHVVVMEFWASWCVACRMSVPTLNAWHDRYGAQGLTVVGVTMDSPEVALQAAIEEGIDYPVLSDTDGETTRAYKAFALPTLFVIDRDGSIRVALVGYSSSGLEHAEATVRELLAGGS